MTEQDALDRIDSYFGLSHFYETPAVEFLDRTTVRLTGCLREEHNFAEVTETYDLSCEDVVVQVSPVGSEILSGVAA